MLLRYICQTIIFQGERENRILNEMNNWEKCYNSNGYNLGGVLEACKVKSANS